jgi:surface-anchored protein
MSDWFRRSAAAGLLLAAGFGLASPASCQNMTVLTTEHVDINAAYSGGQNGTWRLTLRDDDSQIYHASHEAFMHVADPQALATSPGGSAWNFLGLPQGQNTYWRLPASQNPELLYLGVAAYDTPANTFDSYNASTESGGRVTGNGRWVRLTLLHVCGPGHFSSWRVSAGSPVVMMSSADGISETDSHWIPQGGHQHFNFGFSHKGVYRVVFRASGMVGGRRVESPPFLYYFGVGTQSAAFAGQINLLDATNLAQPLTFTFRAQDGGPDVVRNVTLDAEGKFSITNIPLNRLYTQLHIKGRKWLARNVDLCSADINNLAATLIPGDLNDDNIIDLFDLITFFESYGASPGDANWNDGLADLTEDGIVDLFDLITFFTNYGELGDP